MDEEKNDENGDASEQQESSDNDPEKGKEDKKKDSLPIQKSIRSIFDNIVHNPKPHPEPEPEVGEYKEGYKKGSLHHHKQHKTRQKQQSTYQIGSFSSDDHHEDLMKAINIAQEKHEMDARKIQHPTINIIRKSLHKKSPRKKDLPRELEHIIYVEPRPSSLELWDSDADFVMASIGFSDLQTAIEFPTQIAKNGGTSFLIPYILLHLICAVPIIYLEGIIGQSHNANFASIWKLVPLFKGTAIVAVLTGLLTCSVSSYSGILSAIYLFANFDCPPGYASCNNTFNSHECLDTRTLALFSNGSVKTNTTHREHPTVEFYEYYTDGKTSTKKKGDLDFNWIYLSIDAFLYLLVYVTVRNGVTNFGKVSYVITTFIIINLIILCVTGFTLPGSKLGLEYYFRPEMKKLLEFDTWMHALDYVILSYKAGLGIHVAYSYHKSNLGHLFRDTMIVVAANIVLSIIALLTMGSYHGYVATRWKTSVGNIGQFHSLFFEEALITIKHGQVLAFLAHLTFFLLIFTNTVPVVYVFSQAISQYLDSHVTKKRRLSKSTVSLLIVLGVFIFSLPMTFSNSHKIKHAHEEVNSILIYLLGFLQFVGLGWCYGSYMLAEDAKRVRGHSISPFVQMSWKVFLPVLYLMNMMKKIIDHLQDPATYKHTILFTSFLFFVPPFVAIRTWYNMDGDTRKEKLAMAISPVWEHHLIKEGETPARFTKLHWIFEFIHSYEKTCGPHRKRKGKH